MTWQTQELLLAVCSAVASCVLLYLPRRRLSFSHFIEVFWQGVGDIMPILGILLGAFMTQRVSDEMGLPGYIITLVQPYMSAGTMTAIVFLVIAILCFVTSSFWGIEAIAIPIVVPLAAALGADVLPVLGAVVSGGVFGSHACIYADATVLSSATCEVDNMAHAVTQFPYALLGMVLTVIAYLVV